MARLFQTLLMLIIIATVCSVVVASLNETGKNARTKSEQQETKNTVPALSGG